MMKLKKKRIRKNYLCDVQIEIYPDLRKIFLDLTYITLDIQD